MYQLDKKNRHARLFTDDETQTTTLQLFCRKKERVCLIIDHSHPMADAAKVRIFMITRIAFWHCQKSNNHASNMAFIERFYQDAESALAYISPLASYSHHDKQVIVKPLIV